MKHLSQGINDSKVYISILNQYEELNLANYVEAREE
jgi:hypothetical protein